MVELIHPSRGKTLGLGRGRGGESIPKALWPGLKLLKSAVGEILEQLQWLEEADMHSRDLEDVGQVSCCEAHDTVWHRARRRPSSSALTQDSTLPWHHEGGH